jgi:hypothetical protein
VLFFVAFLPISHVIVPFLVPIADRFFYLPSAFLAIALGAALSGSRRAVLGGMAALCAVWAVVTVWDLPRLRSDRAVWEASIRVDPGSFTAHVALLHIEMSSENWEAALGHARVAIARNSPRRELFLRAMYCMEQMGVERTPEFRDEYALYARRFAETDPARLAPADGGRP